MIPYIITPFGSIPSFPVCVVVGVLLLLLLTSLSLRRSGNYIEEENYIFPKIIFSGIVGYFTAGIFDAIVKIPLYGSFKITGVTFYGGFIGAISSLFLLLTVTKKILCILLRNGLIY